MTIVSPEWTWHGGALTKAQAAYPKVDLPWIDLSTGINPNPWPHSDAAAIDWHRLPEAEALRALEEAAAEHYGVALDNICAVSGSEMAMRLTGLVLGGVGQCERGGYRTHAEMFDQCAVLEQFSDATNDFPLILANPANPSGRILPPEDLRALLEYRRDIWTLVDEAYADAHPDISLAQHLTAYPKLLIFKSVGKFFGLAGLRLGFVVGAADWIATLRGYIGAWPVSSAAIAFGTAALKDRAWVAETRAHLERQAAKLDHLIIDSGLKAKGACHLFRLVQTPDAAALFDRLCQHGILTRPFAKDAEHLRLGLPANAAEFTRLSAALRDV